MSIASQITRINTNIAAAYTACSGKGATLPQARNSANLAVTIGSISQGGGSSALDAYIDGSLTAVMSNASSVKSKAFYGDSSITSVSLPSATRAGSTVFSDCINLASVSAPELTSLDANGFTGCTRLASVSLPKLGTVLNQCFKECTTLASISLPLCTGIAYMGFQGCSALASVDLPSISTVGERAFFGCTSLTVLDLHQTSYINKMAFYSCANLNVIILRRTSSVCNLTNIDAFENTPFRGSAGGTIYVPQALIAGYQSATNWSSAAIQNHTTFLPIEGSIYEEASA